MKNGRCQEVFDRKVLAMKGDERGERREGVSETSRGVDGKCCGSRI